MQGMKRSNRVLFCTVIIFLVAVTAKGPIRSRAVFAQNSGRETETIRPFLVDFKDSTKAIFFSVRVAF